MMKIFLFEFIDEVQAAIAQCGEAVLRDQNSLIVAFHPKVKAFLKEINISAIDTIEYLDNNTQHRIILKSEELTFKILDELYLKDSFGIEKGYREFCLHHLRLYFNHFLWLVEVIHNLSLKHTIESISAPVYENFPSMYVAKGYIQDQERFLGLLAQQFCLKRQIRFHAINISLLKESFKEKFLRGFARLVGKILMAIEYNLLSSRKYSKGKTIVVPATSYRMELLLKEIKEKHPTAKSIMIWEGQGSAKQEMFKVYMTLKNVKEKFKNQTVLDTVIHLDLLRGFIGINENDFNQFNQQFDQVIKKIKDEWKNDFKIYEFDLTALAADKITYGLEEETNKLLHTTAILKKVLEKISPKLLMSMYSVGVYYMMGELSPILNYIALNISHGTHVPANNKFEKIENIRLAASVITNTYPHVSVQTPWTNRFLDYYQDNRKRLLTGPLLFSVTNDKDRRSVRREILGNDDHQKIIIHAATQKGRHGMRFHITESLDEYLKTLTDIINAVNQLDDVYFILRPHPICNLSEKEFKLLLPPCSKMRIITKGGFSRLLSASDLLISYSSTCIEEAVQNHIPVILYDQWQRYNHFGGKETLTVQANLNQPAYYLTKTNLLKDQIKIVLKIFNNATLSKNIWPEYIYPKTSKDNFFKFVDGVLENKRVERNN